MNEQRGETILDVALGYILARCLLSVGALALLMPAFFSAKAQWRMLKLILFLPPLMILFLFVYAIDPAASAAFVAVSLLFILS